MTQHNLQVPEEWVEDLLTRASGLPLSRAIVEAHLQAILPKVRERLVDEPALESAATAYERFEGLDKVLEAAFDRAFPPESYPNHAQTTESRSK